MIRLLYFTAQWCAPCKRLKPMVEETMKVAPEVKLSIIDVDEDQALAICYDVKSVPTFIAIDDRYEEVVARSSNINSQRSLTLFLEDLGYL